jgi:hypothetical protein
MTDENPNYRAPPGPPRPPPLPGAGGNADQPLPRSTVRWLFVGGVVLTPFALGAVSAAGLAVGGSRLGGAADIVFLLLGLFWVIHLARKGPANIRPLALGILAGLGLIVLLMGLCFVVVIILLSNENH